MEIPAGRSSPDEPGSCNSPDPPNSPARLAVAFVEDLQEAQSGWSGRCEAARAHEQPHARQIAHRALHRVSLDEILRPSRDFADEIGDRQPRRVPRQNVDQNDALIADVLSFGRRGLVVARLTRLVLHGKHSFLCHAPGCSTSAGALSWSDDNASAAYAETQVLRQMA